MKLGALRALLAALPDDTDIDFADGNFGGRGDDLRASDIMIELKNERVLIRPPYWEAVD
jgi:hypothetical protein